MEKFVEVLRYASHFAPVLLLVIGRRHRGVLWWYAIAAFTADSISVALQKTGNADQWWVGNLFMAVEFGLFSLYYHRALGRPALLTAVAVLFGMGYLVHTFWIGFNTLNLPGGALLCLVYLAYAMTGFSRLLRTTPTLFLDKSGLFWVGAALMLHAAADCLFYLFYQQYLSAQEETKAYWLSFYLVMNVLKVFLLIPAMRHEDSPTWKSA